MRIRTGPVDTGIGVDLRRVCVFDVRARVQMKLGAHVPRSVTNVVIVKPVLTCLVRFARSKECFFSSERSTRTSDVSRVMV